MKVRIFCILLVIACLGLIGSVQATGESSSPGISSPIQEVNPDQGLVEDLSTYITAQMQAAKVSGLSIAVVQGGEIVWVEGFGEANSITGKTVAGDTVFEAASISKAIAAYAALELVERGVLSLDEPVRQSLSQPWLPPSGLFFSVQAWRCYSQEGS
jgi:CubicO group peptidase (beta-lactamase class C family)